LTAGKQGELDWDASKAVMKFGGRAMMGRRSSKCTGGGGGSATNFVRSFVLSLSREKLVRTKDRINSYNITPLISLSGVSVGAQHRMFNLEVAENELKMSN
jgi:hypothetical protein